MCTYAHEVEPVLYNPRKRYDLQNNYIFIKQCVLLKFLSYLEPVWYVCLSNSFQFFWKYV